MAQPESSRSVPGWLSAVILLVLAGCQPAEEPAPAAEPGDNPGRLAGMLETASFTGLEGLPDVVTLTDGQWEGEPYVEGGNTNPAVYLNRTATSVGDLDGDGDDEVVTVLVAKTGGSGSFYYLVALRETGGGLEHFATYFLGDRPSIELLEIADSGVDTVMLVAGEGDALCCPTRRVERRFELDGEAIVLASEHFAEALERIFGYLVWGHEIHSFTNCSGDREGWVIDSVDEHSLKDLYAEFATGPYEPVFVDVEARWLGQQSGGFGEQFDDTIEITGVYRVEREGWGCRLDVDDAIFVASGNEPSWRLELRPDGATLSSINLPAPLAWEGDGALGEQQWEFDGKQRLAVAFREGPCRDTMSGSLFSHAAEVRLDEEVLKGCAVPGRRR